MKLTKLMLSALVAAMALTSCQKDENPSEVKNSTLGSVEIYVNNIAYTKGPALETINSGDQVTLNSLKIFLTNGDMSAVYPAKDAEGNEAQIFWDAETDVSIGDILTQAEPIKLHFIDPAVTKVVAVGNQSSNLTLDELKAATLNVEEQQNPSDLVLYSESELTKDLTHTHDNGLTSNVYTASLTLVPRISRFEVDGFRIKFADPAKFEKVQVLQLAMDDYMPTTSITTGEESGTLVNALTDAVLGVKNNSAVYTWLDANTATGIWWYDNFTAFEMTPTAPAKDFAAGEKLAYHIFSGDQKPQFIIRLLVDEVPAYVYTKNFRLNDLTGDPVTEFQEGYIYRMHAAGESGSGDGSIEIPEDKIDEMDRCLDISVTVHPWKVVVVAPEF